MIRSKLKSLTLASCLFLTPSFNYAYAPSIPADVKVVKTADVVSGNPELFQAIYDHNLERARLLIDGGANLEALMVFRKTSWDNRKYEIYATPLVAAVATGNIDMIRLLLEKGAKINTSGGRVRVPLIEAARFINDSEILELLLRQPGIDVHVAQDRELTWDEYEYNGYHDKPTDILVPMTALDQFSLLISRSPSEKTLKRNYNLLRRFF